MAGDASGIVSRLQRNYTQTLDPVGCRLAVEGRLVSEDADVLTEKLRRSSLTADSPRSGTSAFDAAAAQAFEVSSPQPQQQPQQQQQPSDARASSMQNGRRQSMQDSAFSIASQQAAPDPAACSCGDGSSCPSTCACSCHNIAPWDSRHQASSARSELVMQDTLVDPITGAGQPLRAALSLANGAATLDSLSLEQVASITLMQEGVAAASQLRRPASGSRLATEETPLAATGGAAQLGGSAQGPAPDWGACPPYAVKSTCGKRTCMEDAYALCPNICDLPLSSCDEECVLADKLPIRIAAAFEHNSACLPPSHSAPAASGRTQPLAADAYRRTVSQGTNQQAPANTAAAAVAAAAAAAFSPVQPKPQAGPLHVPLPLPAQSSADAPSTPPQEARRLTHCADSNTSSDSIIGPIDKLHFFAVYDGHGGVEASQHCAKRLHHHLSVALVSMLSPLDAAESGPGAAAAATANAQVNADTGGSSINQLLEAEAAAAVLAEDLLRKRAASARLGPMFGGVAGDDDDGTHEVLPSALADELVAATRRRQLQGQEQGGVQQQQHERSRSPSSSPGAVTPRGAALEAEMARSANSVTSDGASSGDSACSTSKYAQLEEALRDSFIKTDDEFAKDGTAGLVGSTAVVSLVGSRRIWIANCGDSRAVLCRGGQAIQVTDDHKPEREDEAERVEKAGGQVLYWNGHRVMGVLAMSRAIGDHCLRPYVIPEPEITVFARHPADELLLMASDGLWDVMPNQEAMDLALRSMRRAQAKGASRKAAARVACTVLTKAALDRGSRDNITIVIIDLQTGSSACKAGVCAKDGACSSEPAAEKAAAAGAAAAPSTAATAPAAVESPFRTASGASSSAFAAAAAEPAAPGGGSSEQQQQKQQRPPLSSRPAVAQSSQPIPVHGGAPADQAAVATVGMSGTSSAGSSATNRSSTGGSSSCGSSSYGNNMGRQASSSPFSMHALLPLEGDSKDLDAQGPGPAGPVVQGLEMAAATASSGGSAAQLEGDEFGEMAGPFARVQLGGQPG